VIVLQPQKIKTFQQEILDWYKMNKRDLPWRTTRDPYHILVSEIMLQQTQVIRVIPKYEVWFQAFPTIADLAKAQTSDVLRLWSGLGYNRRGLYLKKIAATIVKEYNGQFPRDIATLKTLPGIGEYTARAIACFAFDQQVAVVDTNVRKVILLKFPEIHGMRDKQMQAIADELLPKGKAYDWNHALMDYAALTLTKEKVSVAKQSKFAGSRRYYRGQIIKLLTQKREVALVELATVLNKDTEFIYGIVKELVTEGFLEQQNDLVSLVS